MRFALSVLAVLLLSPSFAVAQIVISTPPLNALDRLDHVVPVATVTRSGDPIVLANAQPGDGFVLGAAQLDLTDPTFPKIAFTITNSTAAPQSLDNVSIDNVRVTSVSGSGFRFLCRTVVFSVGRSANGATWQPGATVTIKMGVAPNCNRTQETLGFLISVRGDGRSGREDDGPLLTKAFTQLRDHVR